MGPIRASELCYRKARRVNATIRLPFELKRLQLIPSGPIIFAACAAAFLGSIACYDKTEGEYARLDQDGRNRMLPVRLIEEGRQAYTTHCIGCHGAEGNGNGDAAKFLHPKPRNFQVANFKFTNVRSGQLPLDEDLKRTIRQGLKGSAMPGFGQLSDHTIDALVAYLKTFSPKWKERPVGSPIPIVRDPYSDELDKSEAIARGEKIYHAYSQCWSCHAAYVSGEQINTYRRQLSMPEFAEFRPDLTTAIGKENAEGQLIYPPDFKRDFVRAGSDAKTLYRSISAGISGTAMPTWVDSMEYSKDGEELVSPSDLWAMAYYIEDLIRHRPKKLGENVVVRDRPEPIYLHGEPPKKKAEPEPDPSAEEPIDIDF